jgi:methionyl-tRNA formyltransferase
VRLAFLGTPEVAAETLRALAAAGHDVRLVVTRPDTRRGRGLEASASPVKQAAEQLGLLVTSTPADVVSSGAELGIVVAYGRLVKPDVLAAVPMVNVHFSLLPRWRGAAPVERAVLAGDAETGVCLMELEEGLDTGPVYARAVTPIGPDETADELRHRLGEMGTELLLKNLAVGLGGPEPQMGEPTYASKISADELRLDFGQAAVICNRVVRVGRAWTTWRGKRLLVHKAQVFGEEQGLSAGQVQGDKVGTTKGALELLVVQPEGKPPMDGAAWARGARPKPGERLGEPDRPQ